MDKRDEAATLMRQLIRLMKTQTAVAKALKTSKQRFNYWFNHANQVPYEQILAMENLLRKKQQEILRLAVDEEKTSLTISQKVHLAMQNEIQMGKRQGKRTDSVTGRTDDLVAQSAGFKNRTYFRYAKKVVKLGSAELITAMDKELLSIPQATRLAIMPHDLQQKLLQTENMQLIGGCLKNQFKLPKAIIRSLKKVTSLLAQHKMLQIAEHHHKLPLRFVLISLIAHANSYGQFHWQPNQLQNEILPFVPIDFVKLLNVLGQCQLIEYIKIKGEPFGQICWQQVLKQ